MDYSVGLETIETEIRVKKEKKMATMKEKTLNSDSRYVDVEPNVKHVKVVTQKSSMFEAQMEITWRVTIVVIASLTYGVDQRN